MQCMCICYPPLQIIDGAINYCMGVTRIADSEVYLAMIIHHRYIEAY